MCCNSKFVRMTEIVYVVSDMTHIYIYERADLMLVRKLKLRGHL
jgi:hypothetical protein